MIINCGVCNKEFYIRPSHFKKSRNHTCSKKCFGVFYSKKYSLPGIKCLHCGKDFKPKSYQTTKYCSRQCFADQKSKRQSILRPCCICGVEMKVINARNKSHTVCGKICANKLHSQRMAESGNSNWKGGIGNLPWGYEFTKILKYKIKRRDNFKCRLCGLKNSELFKGKGYGLIIHHIDYDKQNNKDNNLISLCDVCHGKTGYNRKIWIKKLTKILKK